MAKLMPASEVTCCVIDSGIFHEIAAKLAETYKKVYYHCWGWEKAYPSMNLTEIGKGFPNVEILTSPFGDEFDDIDLFVFPDCHLGPVQVHLESLGKIIWGSRMAEILELDRVHMKELMRSKGLPVGPYKEVYGMDALRKHLTDRKNQWVKVNKFRGQLETFKSKNIKAIEPKLAEVEYKLGPNAEDMHFIVEDDLPDKIEIGTDAYTVDGQFPKSLLAGIEIKGSGFVGVFTEYAKLAPSITRFNQAMVPEFKKYGYRGFFSTELRIGRDKKDYMIDFCARCPSPPNELYQELYKNLAKIIWNGANGIMVDPEPIAKYGAEAVMHSTWAINNWQPVEFPKDLKLHIKLRNALVKKGRYYNIPQGDGGSGIGGGCGLGRHDAGRDRSSEGNRRAGGRTLYRCRPRIIRQGRGGDCEDEGFRHKPFLMNIRILVIPHKEQPYNTAGMWDFMDDGTLEITVSALGNTDMENCIAIHEQVEAILCQKAGITSEAATEFDRKGEESPSRYSQPGDDPSAPYYREHLLATMVERTIADRLGVDWTSYEQKLAQLVY